MLINVLETYGAILDAKMRDFTFLSDIVKLDSICPV